MANPKSPGAYVQEIPKLPASVAEVETAIPAFIGYTDKAVKKGVSVNMIPTRISSMLEFEEIFGGAYPEAFTATIDDVYDLSGKLTRSISASISSVQDFKMYYSLQMFFANGGGKCYIVSVGQYPTSSVDDQALIAGITALEKFDEPTLLVFPDFLPVADYSTVYNAALASCAKLQDRFTIMDIKEETDDVEADADNFRSFGVGPDNLKYGAVYYPQLNTTLNYGFEDSTVIIEHNRTLPPTDAEDFDNDTLADVKADNASLYKSIVAELNKIFVTLPASSIMAGIYARVDAERGVWKAPANVGVRSVVGPTVNMTTAENDYLNIDATSGKSINAIRSFTGKGTLVWGARTLAGNDNEWRYVPVRRFFNFAEESIKKATEFVVFEPNDANTWLRTKAMIENFLTTQWRQGALAGAKKEDAFFVNVGLGTTMTALDILEGRLNIEIGMAVVRPAEFIILKFSHKLQES
jgi:phage tail sheath protein FI